MKRFGVALWRWWPQGPASRRVCVFPEWTGTVEAESAYSAVVQVMHFYGLTSVAAAASYACDGSLRCWFFRVSGVSRGLIWFAGRPEVLPYREVKDGFFV